MNYQAFYNDVVVWIGQANQLAMQHGIGSEAFWNWVTNSCADICRRYNNNPLVIRQMMMLADWLEDAMERSKAG